MHNSELQIGVCWKMLNETVRAIIKLAYVKQITNKIIHNLNRLCCVSAYRKRSHLIYLKTNYRIEL